MLPKISLLDELRKGGYEASLITTFNAYVPFYEEVVLRRLINAGVRHNVLMMDATQYAHCLASQAPQLAGRHYTLLPVKVAGAFHPKLVFLAGKHKGLILIGSHNLTLAGFGFNRELTNLVRIQGEDDSEGITLAQDVWTELEAWLTLYADRLPDHVKRMVLRVRDFAPWLTSAPVRSGEITLLAGRPGARTLWDQLTDLIEPEAVDISITGAFFDGALRFLERVSGDLAPKRLTVAVDPGTVDISPRAKTLPGVNLVRADGLGIDEGTETGTGRYLHAKGIFVQPKNGDAVFASGSANPSAPAWLASETQGNVELMLAYRGEQAMAAATSVGFTEIAQMPALSETDWQLVAANAGQRADPEPPGFRSGIAVVEDSRASLDRALLEGLSAPVFVLNAADGAEIDRSSEVRLDDETASIAFPSEQLEHATALDVLAAGEVRLKLLLHHVRAIEEQARSGTQRRFKEALLSLETDTPNIELLIQCIDKIVFSEAGEISTELKRRGSRENASPPEPEDSGSLAIDVEDVKHRKGKKRLSHSGDFAYLLDALIYHLRMEKVPEERDSYGRTEEEQIGADDDPDADGKRAAAQNPEELLDVCHARVATVINRMVAQLTAYANGKQLLVNVLVRLLAVLAVLRELRSCDGRVPWVEKGKTTVPLKHRQRLLEEIMFNLFEGSTSLLRLDSLGEEFQHSDDVARLKGLVLWLAWDCQLTMDLKKPFMETPEQLEQRLKRNAMILALTEMIEADEIVFDEARQSIGSLTTSEMDWLRAIQRLASDCDSLRHDHSALQSAESAQPGDIAIHRNVNPWTLRIVAGSDGKSTSLVKLSRDKARLGFRSEHLAVVRLT